MKDPVYFEKKTMTAMISIYCESVHREKVLCEQCKQLKEYALQRVDHCVFGPDKPTCKNCPVHCYSPKRKEEIKKIMRFSGPVMLYKHPVLAIIHLLKNKRKIQKFNKLTTQ